MLLSHFVKKSQIFSILPLQDNYIVRDSRLNLSEFASIDKNQSPFELEKGLVDCIIGSRD